MKIYVTIFDDLDKFDSEDFQTYQNRLLLRVLETILAQKGYLKAQDIYDAYEQCWVLILQDPVLLAKNWCLLNQLGDHSGNPSKCFLTQLGDAVDLGQDALELSQNMNSYVMLRLYEQPADKRLQMIDHLTNVFTRRSKVEIPSGYTFTGFFQELLGELNEIDEVMVGVDFKFTPALESLLREMGPKIVLKIKKYYDNTHLRYEECQFCNSRWGEKPEEADISNFRNVSCCKTAEELESVLVLRFRRFFYLKLRNFLPYMAIYYSQMKFEK